MTLWLVGMMGSGKTSAGRAAASSLGVEFWDTDALVEESVGMSIEALWAEEGEAGFRLLEEEALSEVAGAEGIVATGGGAVLSRRNRDTMRDSGIVVWLDAGVETLAARIGHAHGRPLLGVAEPGPELGSIWAQRRDLYQAVAHHRIDTDPLTVAQVAERIGGLWPR